MNNDKAEENLSEKAKNHNDDVDGVAEKESHTNNKRIKFVQ